MGYASTGPTFRSITNINLLELNRWFGFIINELEVSARA